MVILYYLFYDPIQKFNNTFEKRGIPIRKTEENMSKFGQLIDELSTRVFAKSIIPTLVNTE